MTLLVVSMSQPFQTAAILFVILFVDWNVKNINF